MNITMRIINPLFRSFTLIAAALFIAVSSLYAQISPGELSRFHAQSEGIARCTDCHELRKEVSDEKCLVCHSSLQARIAAGRGYHAASEVKEHSCRECHSEHNGRDYELIHWKDGRDRFDHGRTGFQLTGAHARQECRFCHKIAFIAEEVARDATVNRDRTFLGVNPACMNCHADEHRDQLSDDCAGCHDANGWAPAPGFSHEKTRYPLIGKHSQVSCVQCHPLQTAPFDAGGPLIAKKNNVGTYSLYSGLSFNSCADCHEDAHHGKFGTSCSGCHTTEGFNRVKDEAFDHDRTAYPLTGKHRDVECTQCHRSGRMTESLRYQQCSDCHTDRHRGQFAHRRRGGACDECHSVNRFVPGTFDLAMHDSTRYPLTGSHRAIPCIACHTGIESSDGGYMRFQFPDQTCHDCHSDPHNSQLNHWIEKNGCEFCHSTETWHRTSFDHKLSRFPLEGKHREILCLKCHTVVRAETGDSTLWMKPLVMECSDCHTDVHNGQFIRQNLSESAHRCDRCHKPEGWSQLRFDHNRDAAFALDGAHQKAACSACHPTVVGANGNSFIVYRPLGTACTDCHGSMEVQGSSHE